MVFEGVEAVPAARQLIGATNPVEAAPGSIRGDFALEVTFNMVHGSDSDESAEREIGIWFPELLLSVRERELAASSSSRELRVVLASGSPQRREILEKLGVEFEVVVPGVEELSGGDPEVEVVENARLKARAVDAGRGRAGDRLRYRCGARREGAREACEARLRRGSIWTGCRGGLTR